MLPTKHVTLMNFPVGVNSKGKLIPSAIDTNKQQILERHVKAAECLIGPKVLILSSDFCYGPDHFRAVLIGHTIGF